MKSVGKSQFEEGMESQSSSSRKLSSGSWVWYVFRGCLQREEMSFDHIGKGLRAQLTRMNLPYSSISVTALGHRSATVVRTR